jgi:fumarate reductase flavoprotein subunit
LARAASALADIGSALGRYRMPDAARERGFNMTWHDWLNLSNLVEVSKVIVRAAQSRENSRGAHFRADFPEPGDLATSRYTRARQAANGDIAVESVPVVFNRVRPGQSLV